MSIGTWHKNKWWAEYASKILPTGSRVICNPVPEKTDEDFLLLVDKETVKPFCERLYKEGFTLGGSMDRDGDRESKKYISEGTNAVLYEEAGWVDAGPDSVIISAGVPYHLWIYKPKPSEKIPVLVEYPDFTMKDHSDVFASFKNKENLNLIITCSPEYYENFSKATRLATYLNLLQKTHRVALFQGLCFDDWPNNDRY